MRKNGMKKRFLWKKEIAANKYKGGKELSIADVESGARYGVKH